MPVSCTAFVGFGSCCALQTGTVGPAIKTGIANRTIFIIIVFIFSIVDATLPPRNLIFCGSGLIRDSLFTRVINTSFFQITQAKMEIESGMRVSLGAILTFRGQSVAVLQGAEGSFFDRDSIFTERIDASASSWAGVNTKCKANQEREGSPLAGHTPQIVAQTTGL
jgi:hypothetical protein